MKRTTLQKIDSQEEELDVIDDIDGIGNLEDLLRKVIIHEECGNLKVLVDGESLLEILTKRRSQTYTCPLCYKFYRREYFFNKYVVYHESVR